MIKLWLANFKQRRLSAMRDQNRKLFESILNDPSSGMKTMVAQRAAEVASSMVMKWMDDKRIRHCRLCPDTDTMRMFRGLPFCNTHYQPVVDASLAEDAKTKAAEESAKKTDSANATNAVPLRVAV